MKDKENIENLGENDYEFDVLHGKVIHADNPRIKMRASSHITLSEWLMGAVTKDELVSLFASMDSAMKYIHNKGYCICSFHPKDIEILNDSLNQIKFNLLMMMPDELAKRKSIVKEDIGRSAFLQIGIYSRCLNCLKPEFLKEHFEEFSTLLPEDMVPYYRGIVERGASVYLGDYLNEKRKRDLMDLEKEVGESASSVSNGKRLVKGDSGFSILEEDSMNTKVNDSIYKSLNSFSDSAYVSFLMIPILVAILGIIFAIIVFS